MLLGFYNRKGEGLAVQMPPEMAAIIAYRVRNILISIGGESSFEDVSEIRLARYAFEYVYLINQYDKSANSSTSGFFELPDDQPLYDSGFEPTGVFIDIEDIDPWVFWEIYDAYSRQETSYLSLAQLDAIASNQPLPIE